MSSGYKRGFDLRFFLSLVICPISNAPYAFDCLDIAKPSPFPETRVSSLSDDFSVRDAWAQTEVPAPEWSACCGSFGPCPHTFPKVAFPPSLQTLENSRQRVLLAAKKFRGLPYMHKHIPAAGGLDCSNFTAWVYNYALGIRFSSHVVTQSETAGRKLSAWEKLEAGDLLFLWSQERDTISHVAIFMDQDTVIDSSGNDGVAIQPNAGRHRERLAWARRILE